jgi:hypothetical protein
MMVAKSRQSEGVSMGDYRIHIQSTQTLTRALTRTHFGIISLSKQGENKHWTKKLIAAKYYLTYI